MGNEGEAFAKNRTDFSAFESGSFSGIATTVWWFWFSRGAVLFFRGFVRFSYLCFLVCSKWWKSLELRAWILVWTDCSETEGHTLENWERHSIICLFSSLRFEHMALIVLPLMLCENVFWVRWISWRYFRLKLEILEKMDAWKFERKPLWVTLCWRYRLIKSMWLEILVLVKMWMASQYRSTVLVFIPS